MDSFKGTSADQDIRFGDKERKLLKSLKFPAELSQKVRVGVRCDSGRWRSI